MSEEGYNKLVAELRQLEAVERPKIVAAIAEARDKGDLSENAEYDAAKEAQGLLEMKINKLKAVIADAKIIDESKLKTDSVQILNKVELKNVKNGMKMTYTGSSSRSPRITLTKTMNLWSLPDKVIVRINPGDALIKSLALSFKTPNGDTFLDNRTVSLTPNAVKEILQFRIFG